MDNSVMNESSIQFYGEPSRPSDDVSMLQPQTPRQISKIKKEMRAQNEELKTQMQSLMNEIKEP